MVKICEVNLQDLNPEPLNPYRPRLQAFISKLIGNESNFWELINTWGASDGGLAGQFDIIVLNLVEKIYFLC